MDSWCPNGTYLHVGSSRHPRRARRFRSRWWGPRAVATGLLNQPKGPAYLHVDIRPWPSGCSYTGTYIHTYIQCQHLSPVALGRELCPTTTWSEGCCSFFACLGPLSLQLLALVPHNHHHHHHHRDSRHLLPRVNTPSPDPVVPSRVQCCGPSRLPKPPITLVAMLTACARFCLANSACSWSATSCRNANPSLVNLGKWCSVAPL
ncbi:hypothetical protein IWX49DRAFT_209820 [Phyllosticta citricarpa]